jgi:hypothetical protein
MSIIHSTHLYANLCYDHPDSVLLFINLMYTVAVSIHCLLCTVNLIDLVKRKCHV